MDMFEILYEPFKEPFETIKNAYIEDGYDEETANIKALRGLQFALMTMPNNKQMEEIKKEIENYENSNNEK